MLRQVYTHSVSHAQFLWLHYTHCVLTGYGTLSKCGHTTSGSSGMLMTKVCVCLFCACHKSPLLAFLFDVSPVLVCFPSPRTTSLNGSVFLQCVKPLFLFVGTPLVCGVLVVRQCQPLRFLGVWSGHSRPPVVTAPVYRGCPCQNPLG